MKLAYAPGRCCALSYSALLCSALVAGPGTAHAQKTPAVVDTVVANDWPGTSLFHLDHAWVDQNNKPREISDYGGKHVVLALIFTNCRFSCPITIAHLKALEEKLSAAERKDVQFVLVTLDPERDKPGVLKAFAKTHELNDERWTFLHGDSSDVRELSVALQLRYKETGKGEFSHGRAITILDPQGVIAYQGQKHSEELVVLRKKIPATGR